MQKRKKSFFSHNQEPLFVYEQIPHNEFLAYKEQLQALHFSDSPIHPMLLPLYEGKRDEIIERIDLLLQQDTQSFYSSSEKYFDISFSQSYLDQARDRIHTYKDFTIHPSEDIAATFRSILDRYHFNTYKIVISKKTGFNVRPNTTKKVIIISKSAHTDILSAQALVMHELTHIIRYENANGIDPIFRIRTKGSLGCEEGIATYIEDMFSKGSIYQHAVEYLGCHFSRTHSLQDTFAFLLDHKFSKELAWQRAIRMKFGVCDTKQPGVYAKTATYFEKMIETERYIAAGNDLNTLLVGKICLADIPIYERMYPNRSLRYQKEIFNAQKD